MVRMVRDITPSLIRDLKKKMVILAGPRQSGKTTLAKSLLDKNGQYLNWDITKDRTVIRSQAWPKDSSLIVLDELHKAPKWKNILKGIVDEFHNKPPLLVTGSARLDILRKTGDALTGRQYFYRLHPVDVAESATFLPKLSLDNRVKRLIETGGFPEALLNPADALRLRNDRLEMVIKEDLRDLSRVGHWRGPADLVELLRERVGKPVNYDSLAQDLRVSPPTVKNWVELLEKLYIVFLLNPYSGHLARSIRKEKRIYFFDCGSAYDSSLGSQLENLVACSLLKFVHFQKDSTGENWDLYYLRDKEKREVDFVVTRQRKVEYLIEVKKSDPSPNLGIKHYQEILRPKEAIQLVLDLDRSVDQFGVRIRPLGMWLEGLGRSL